MLVLVDQPVSIGAVLSAVARAANRLQGQLIQIRPSLERVLGPRIE